MLESERKTWRTSAKIFGYGNTLLNSCACVALTGAYISGDSLTMTQYLGYMAGSWLASPAIAVVASSAFNEVSRRQGKIKVTPNPFDQFLKNREVREIFSKETKSSAKIGFAATASAITFMAFGGLDHIFKESSSNPLSPEPKFQLLTTARNVSAAELKADEPSYGFLKL